MTDNFSILDSLNNMSIKELIEIVALGEDSPDVLATRIFSKSGPIHIMYAKEYAKIVRYVIEFRLLRQRNDLPDTIIKIVSRDISEYSECLRSDLNASIRSI